jgi:hypothetical protein
MHQALPALAVHRAAAGPGNGDPDLADHFLPLDSLQDHFQI